MSQPKPKSNQKHKTWKKENSSKEDLDDRSEMIRAVEAAAGSGKVKVDSGDDDLDEEQSYAKGGAAKKKPVKKNMGGKAGC